MSIVEWIQANITAEYGPLVMSVTIALLFLILYDFYHLLFSAVLSWFKKG